VEQDKQQDNLYNKRRTMKIIVDGGSGFVGTETIKVLEKEGHEVFNYDLMSGYDIRDIDQLYEVAEEFKPDRWCHLAAIARFADADKDPKLAFETNAVGTKNVAEVCKELHIPLVYSSTGSVYMPITEGAPITESFKVSGNSQYACSKLIGEKFVEEHTPHIILRYAHIFGKEKRGHGLIGGYWDRIRRGLQPMIYGGEQSNDFCYVKDIAQANLKALTAPWDKWNQIYNIGTGEELTAKSAGDMVCEITGWTGGVEQMGKREVDPPRFFYDITKAKVMLGYEPEWTFKEGLKEMFDDITPDKLGDSDGHSNI
jgi:UDP-glucose 4-epimerase